tara:strand:+ start:124 stop:645 length:522 start_codon:yes stop_codon:yes gene_type:complete
MKKIFLLIFFFLSLLISNSLLAEYPRYIDFKYVLNESVAGKKAQEDLKKQYNRGVKNLTAKEKKLQEEEKKLIQQKKIISADEYKKKVTELRNKVKNLQKEKNQILEKVANQRAKAKSELLKNLNPIIKEYMVEKQIRMVIDKKNLILGDENLDITKEIISRLNGKLKSIKLN